MISEPSVPLFVPPGNDEKSVNGIVYIIHVIVGLGIESGIEPSIVG